MTVVRDRWRIVADRQWLILIDVGWLSMIISANSANKRHTPYENCKTMTAADEQRVIMDGNR